MDRPSRKIPWLLISCVSVVILPYLVTAGCGLLLLGMRAFSGTPKYTQVTFDLAPDGRQAVFSTKGGALHLLDLKTGAKKPLEFPGSPADRCFPTLSPDGRKVAFSANSDLWIASLDGKSVRRLTHDDVYSEFSPRFSPDGSRLVFERATNERRSPKGRLLEHGVWTIRADGTELRQLTSGKFFNVSGPAFTPDSKTVIFAADVPVGDSGDQRQALFEVAADGKTPPREFFGGQPDDEGGSAVNSPALSSDGKRFVFVSDKGEPFRYDIALLDRDGKNLRRLGLGTVPSELGQPHFSRDGKAIFYLEGDALWRADADGRNARKVADLAS